MTLLAALLLAGGQPALANAGDCGWVHGRYSLYNGAGVRRIWMIGTRHTLNLYDEDEELPAAIVRLEKSGEFSPASDEIYGDFYVCARERRIPGHMQHVRFKDAKRLRVVRR
jgi:hypothetical protein